MSTHSPKFHGEIRKNTRTFYLKKKNAFSGLWQCIHTSHKRINYQTAITAKRTVKCSVIFFLQFCLYGSWDSLGPEFMHPKLKLYIQPGTRGEIFCCVLDFSFKLV